MMVTHNPHNPYIATVKLIDTLRLLQVLQKRDIDTEFGDWLKVSTFVNECYYNKKVADEAIYNI